MYASKFDITNVDLNVFLSKYFIFENVLETISISLASTEIKDY